MSKPKMLEKYRKALFESETTTILSDAEREKVTRYRAIYAVWLNNPSISRAMLKDFIKNTYPFLSDSQIYRDIHDIHILLGSVQNASRSHIQFVVNETLLELISELRGNPKRSKELILAVDKLAKYNQLHQDAPEPVDWSQMVDFVIEPTSDPSVLGIDSVENLEELKSKLYKKYAEDIDFVEIKKGDNGTSS